LASGCQALLLFPSPTGTPTNRHNHDNQPFRSANALRCIAPSMLLHDVGISKTPKGNNTKPM
jgi:hypothetical protein